MGEAYRARDAKLNRKVRRFLTVKMERSNTPEELRVFTRLDREVRKAPPVGGERP